MRVHILDDLERVALGCADWGSLGPDVTVVAHDRHLDGDELVTALRDADAVVVMRERTPLTADLVAALPGLRLVVTTGARNAAIDLAACAARGIIVCGTSGGSPSVVELAWALILAAVRSVPAHDAAMRDGRWAPTAGTDLAGRTLGLVGLGRTGSRMAAIGAAFGMDVVAWSQNLTAERARECGARAVSKAELFAGADIVSLHVLLSDRTRHLVGAAELAAMRSTAWLVNTSRGPVVDEAALVEACRTGAIAGAALDVYDVEPLPADHVLRRLPNVVLTPHVGYVTLDTFRAWYTDVVEDLRAWRAGAPVRVLADERGNGRADDAQGGGDHPDDTCRAQ